MKDRCDKCAAMERVLDECRRQAEVSQRVIDILCDEVKRLAKLATEEKR